MAPKLSVRNQNMLPTEQPRADGASLCGGWKSVKIWSTYRAGLAPGQTSRVEKNIPAATKNFQCPRQSSFLLGSDACFILHGFWHHIATIQLSQQGKSRFCLSYEITVYILSSYNVQCINQLCYVSMIPLPNGIIPRLKWFPNCSKNQ